MAHNPFVGAWRLVAAEMKNAGGAKDQMFGPNPTGYLMYSEDGHMAVLIMHEGRKNFGSQDLSGGTVEEKAEAAATFLAYSGTYEVRAASEVTANSVIHHIEASLFPNWTGSHQERFFEFSGDRLILRTPPMLMLGSEVTGQLIWQRF